ncbi:hypothetical protein GQX73_g10092 [Xylaria multiplex]|uniref:Uncharacterized protein n=1 Tax=Xylaria multiplex TaxID=323545 RepID=A0A7C8ITG9_9PEZI|nr:hypothetical protein GQX73_g10092 [Xylaria multiplex]
MKLVTYSIPVHMLGPIHRSLRFSKRGLVPGGHVRPKAAEGEPTREFPRLIYETEALPVDEDSWFSFLKKSRWWDTVWVDPDPLINGIWSVDNETIWAHLRIALELANRIFKALIKERHPFLHTALFGHITRWTDPMYQPTPCPEPFPGATVLLSYPFRRRRWAQVNGFTACPYPDWAELTDEDWAKRLEHLLERQQLGFTTGEDPDCGEFYGLHIPQYKCIVFDIGTLRKLIEDDLTLAERCIVMVQFAGTIVHELYGWQQKFEPIIAQQPKGGLLVTESALFGGELKLFLNVGFKRNWPNPFINRCHGIKAAKHPFFYRGLEEVVTVVPAFWAAKMLSREFWEDGRIPRKSDNFFHSVDHFRSRWRVGSAITIRPPPGIANNPEFINKMSQGTLPEEIKDLLDDWKSRAALWAQARAGWYEQQQKNWKLSSWGRLLYRAQFYKFDREIKKPLAERDEFKCFIPAIISADAVEWPRSMDYFNSLQRYLKSWHWHVVGLLMLAVLPIQPTIMTRERKSVKYESSMEPSSTNPNLGRTMTRSAVQNDWYPTSIPEMMFTDPFAGGALMAPGTYTQMDYLDLVQKVVNHYADRGPMSKPWVDEIVRVEANIRKRRIEVVHEQSLQGGNPWLVWVDEVWDFQVPSYSLKEHIYVKESNTWLEA